MSRRMDYDTVALAGMKAPGEGDVDPTIAVGLMDTFSRTAVGFRTTPTAVKG
jgi:hypothetical protein